MSVERPPLGWRDVDLNELAPVVDAHQLQAQADLHLLPGRAQGGGHRVESVLAGHVVIGVDLGGAPVGDLVGLAVPGSSVWRSSSRKTCRG